jgi:signal transduction histidine kinase
VHSDRDGVLWLGTGHGIARVSRTALEAIAEVTRLKRGTNSRAPSIEITTFEISDQGRDVAIARGHQPNAWRSHDGTLWFASTRGVVRVEPQRMRANLVPPTIVIETAIIDGQRVRPTEDRRLKVLPPGAGTLEFHFGAITLLEPQKARHRYRLEGFDADWIDAGTRRIAYYANIPPGRYRFRVQGSNGDGVWNRAGQAMEFELTPHFYQRIWFYLSCWAVLLAFAAWLHHTRLTRIQTRHAATLQERKRLARELHDSFLQGMSGAMMQIRGIRKRLARASDDPTAPTAAVEDLKTLEEMLGVSLAETRQYVWGLREQEPVKDLHVSLGETIARVTSGQTVRWDMKVEGRPFPLPAETAREILRITQEAFTNVVKHARASNVELRLRYERSSLALCVEDDGQGFDPMAPERASGCLGIVGMRERAARIGKLTITSRPGAGTTLRLDITRSSRGNADD